MARYDVQQPVKLIAFFCCNERSIIQTHKKYRQSFNVTESNMIAALY